MKNQLNISLLWVLILLSASCTITDPTKAGKWLMIGEGGGITGAYTNFYMLPNGKIYRREQSDTQYVILNPMPGRIARGYFRDLPGVFTSPGDKPLPDNIHKTLIWYKKGVERKITWMYPNERSDRADEFYNFLMREMYEYNPTATQ
jgi:hypothetical protein